MVSVKTAISIDGALFQRADAVARELGVARSQVFALALEEYLRRREDRSYFEQINAALADDLQTEETSVASKMRRLSRQALDAK